MSSHQYLAPIHQTESHAGPESERGDAPSRISEVAIMPPRRRQTVVGGSDGDPLPYSPEWTSTLDVNYEWSAFGDATAYVGGAWRYVGEQSNGFPGVGGFLNAASSDALASLITFVCSATI